MNTMMAFAIGEANRGKKRMVFDWNKAAKIIRERKPRTAAAGLHSDWEYTGGLIFSDGKPVTNEYTYLASTWATPELMIDGEIIPCYIMEHKTKWNEDTKWPKSAIDILNGKAAIE